MASGGPAAAALAAVAAMDPGVGAAAAGGGGAGQHKEFGKAPSIAQVVVDRAGVLDSKGLGDVIDPAQLRFAAVFKEYFKDDGSLKDDGMAAVFAPVQLSIYANFAAVSRKLKAGGNDAMQVRYLMKSFGVDSPIKLAIALGKIAEELRVSKEAIAIMKDFDPGFNPFA